MENQQPEKWEKDPFKPWRRIALLVVPMSIIIVLLIFVDPLFALLLTVYPVNLLFNVWINTRKSRLGNGAKEYREFMNWGIKSGYVGAYNDNEFGGTRLSHRDWWRRSYTPHTWEWSVLSAREGGQHGVSTGCKPRGIGVPKSTEPA